MKYLLILSMLFIPFLFRGQSVVIEGKPTTGFIYSKGITWTENKSQDSAIKIIIEGDTMVAIRNLLLYCLQEKEENEYSFYVLNRLDLDFIATLAKSKDFDFYLKEYRKVILKNKLKRGVKPKKKK